MSTRTADWAEIAEVAERWSPEELLRWAGDRFAPRLALATGLGAEGCALIDLAARAEVPVEIFTLDTGLFFLESYGVWRALEERYGITIHAVRPAQTVREQAETHGDRLWERDGARCCELRKTTPLTAYLAGKDAWITAIRRDQTSSRASARPVEWDARFGLVKVNPLVGWTKAEVWEHIRTHDVPYNPLHDQGFPSIGCHPCTSAVADGESDRAGRWRGTRRDECGLHVRPVALEVRTE